MNLKYKRMLEGMRKKEKVKRGRKKKDPWFLYILRCGDGTFYTGITNHLERRLKMHQDGRGARYTRTRRPVELIYQEALKSRTHALVRECAVKALPRKSKEALAGSVTC